MFLNITNKVLPKCKVAHSIRQSYLYLYKTHENQDINDEISTKYPLPYYYVQKGHNTSFYYHKNNLIAYYIHSKRNKNLRVIHLYDYVKNVYQIILLNFRYGFMNHNEVCVVKVPNNQMYIVAKRPPIIKNINKGTLLHDYIRATSNKVKYLFHSMPIANSFVLVIMKNGNEIFIHVIDLIKEKINIQRYSIEKIIKNILSSLEKNDIYYEEISLIKNSDKLSLDVEVTVKNSIDNSVAELIFYNKCIVDISLRFENTKKGSKKKFNGALSVIAIYQNKKLTVSLQINKNINIEAYYSKNVDLGTDIVLISSMYEIDDKYDLSQSKLYSVIFSSGDYTIIGEPNMSSVRVAAYYKNNPSFVFLYPHLHIENFNDILFISTDDKKLVSINKNMLAKAGNLNQYYIKHVDSYVDIIETKAIVDLISDSIRQSHNTNWVTIDANGVVKQVKIENILVKKISRYFNLRGHFVISSYLHYIDYEKKELYSLIYLSGVLGSRFYLFNGKVDCLLSKNNCFRLVWGFETNASIDKIPSFLFSQLRGNRLNTYSKILRLLSNQWNTGNGFIALKVLKEYSKPNAYYDYSYNRKSITISPIDTSIASTLHLVIRIK